MIVIKIDEEELSDALNNVLNKIQEGDKTEAFLAVSVLALLSHVPSSGAASFLDREQSTNIKAMIKRNTCKL